MDALTGGAGMDVLSGGLNRDFFAGHGPGAPGDPTAPENFDTYKDEFNLAAPVFGRAAGVKGIAATELRIQDALAGLAAIANKPADFNLPGRVRYLGSGEYLVKLGPPDEIADDLGNPNPFGWAPVSFDGTWTDNDPRPSAQEWFLPARVATEMREFWTVLFHRAVAQSFNASYDPFTHYTQGDYEALDARLTTPALVIEGLSGKAPEDPDEDPATGVGYELSATPPDGFTFGNILTGLAEGRWLTAEASASPTPASGVVADQAYAITKAFTTRTGAAFVTLYNPSGFDKGLTPSGAADATGAARDDGFITLSAADFFGNFAFGYKN
jgi:hypothetical protein